MILGGLTHLAGLVSQEAKMFSSFQIGSKELCQGLPTYPLMLAERVGTVNQHAGPAPQQVTRL